LVLTGSDNTITILALVFDILIVALIVSGSLGIMAYLNPNTIPTSVIMEMQGVPACRKND